MGIFFLKIPPMNALKLYCTVSPDGGSMFLCLNATSKRSSLRDNWLLYTPSHLKHVAHPRHKVENLVQGE